MKLVDQLLLLNHDALLHQLINREHHNEVGVDELLQDDAEELDLVNTRLVGGHDFAAIFVTYNEDPVDLAEVDHLVDLLFNLCVLVKVLSCTTRITIEDIFLLKLNEFVIQNVLYGLVVLDKSGAIH